jgi:hypothetical protein
VNPREKFTRLTFNGYPTEAGRVLGLVFLGFGFSGLG